MSLKHQIVFLYQNGNFCCGRLLAVDEYCEEMSVTKKKKSQQLHGAVSKTLT